jgi:hypothetical protein
MSVRAIEVVWVLRKRDKDSGEFQPTGASGTPERDNAICLTLADSSASLVFIDVLVMFLVTPGYCSRKLRVQHRSIA